MSAAWYVGLSVFEPAVPVRVQVVRRYPHHVLVRFPGASRVVEVHPDALRATSDRPVSTVPDH